MTREQQIQHLNSLADTAKTILTAKGDDYANTDRLSNFKDAGKIVGISPEQQCLSMIAVKVARLGNLLKPGASPKNESVKDSILDLFCYAALLHMIESEHEL